MMEGSQTHWSPNFSDLAALNLNELEFITQSGSTKSNIVIAAWQLAYKFNIFDEMRLARLE